LDLIKRNVELNKSHQRYPKNVEVYELDFLAKTFLVKIEEELKTVEIGLAADGESIINLFNSCHNIFSQSVIYDQDITDGFIKTILKLFKISPKLSELYIALEKRYVFVESVCAPMFEHFLKNFQQFANGVLKLNEMSTEFPQYFEYDRCKELVLLKVTRV
jgi:methyltransferase-like protein 22